MRYIFNLVPVCMAFVLLSSCVEEEQALEQPEVRLVSVTGTTVAEDGSGAEVNFEAAGGSVDVEVSANCDWTVESGLGYWYAIEILDDSSFRITASDNQEGGVRYANVSVAASNGAGVSSASVVLRQAAPGQESAIPIEYTLQGEDTDVIIPGQGGTYRIEVSCAENWTAISLSNWIAVEQDAAGFTITAGENSTIGMRTGSVCISAGNGGEENTVIIPVSQTTASTSAMVIEVTVGEETGNAAILPFDTTNGSGVINCIVDWGDGTMSRVLTDYPSHQYDAPGVYNISITGKVASFRANQSPELNTIRPTITAVRQWGDIGLESLKYGFYYCANLKEIAAPDEDSFSQLTSIYSCFDHCTSLEAIPEGMFSKAPRLNEAYSAFSACESLKEIPAKVFAGCSEVTRFSMVFKNCKSVTAVAPDVFEGCNPEEGFLQAFYATAISSIPEGIFKWCTAAENMSNIFANCTSLTSIPADLFSGMTSVTNLMSAFSGCTGLTSVPGNLFADVTAVTNMSSVFKGCTGLTSVPEGIFDGLVKVTNFNSLFSGCTSLTTVPVSIFDDCTAVTNFGKTFGDCTSLAGESPYTEVDGVRCHLYERGGSSAFATVKTTAGCFTGCTGLADYQTIETSYAGWL